MADASYGIAQNNDLEAGFTGIQDRLFETILSCGA
jgi:hypothetical protein